MLCIHLIMSSSLSVSLTQNPKWGKLTTRAGRRRLISPIAIPRVTGLNGYSSLPYALLLHIAFSRGYPHTDPILPNVPLHCLNVSQVPEVPGLLFTTSLERIRIADDWSWVRIPCTFESVQVCSGSSCAIQVIYSLPTQHFLCIYI
jgi:hypothetical protein